jgi:hypothetical protein
MAAGDDQPAPLTERQLDNVVALARLVGYVRYFHPSDESAGADWDIVTIEGMEAVLKAENAAELATKLEKHFQPLAPTLRVFPTGQRPPDAGKLAKPEGATRLMIWRHFSAPIPRKPDKVSSVRIDVKREAPLPANLADRLEKEVPTPDPDKPFEADLGGGVSCLMPLALYADGKSTLPAGEGERFKKFSSKPRDFVPDPTDRATRLAVVVLAWNSAQHFFPYFDIVTVDWPAELRRALARAFSDTNADEFYGTLFRMMGALHDGHLAVLGPGVPKNYLPPARWDWIEDRLTIVRVAKEAAAKLQPGDIVLKIDRQDTAKVLEKRKEISPGASEAFRLRIAIFAIAMGKKDNELELEIQAEGSATRKVTLERTMTFQEFYELKPEPRPLPIAEVKPGMWYIDVERAKPADFEAALPRLEKAAGIVFDVRGYPRIDLEMLLEHLIDKPISSVPVYLPVVLYPDRRRMSFLRGNSTTFEPKEPRLRARVAFLTDARAISAAETLLSMAEHHKLGAIVGSPTAGTNGNVRVVMLPAGYDVQFTGIKVLNYDGTPFHGRGVPLTLTARRTRQGVLSETDDVLQQALKYLAD